MKHYSSCRVLVAALAMLFAGCNNHSSVAETERTVALFSLDPTAISDAYLAGDPIPPGEKFHGYLILGKFEVEPAELQAKLLLALQTGLDEGEGMSKCFWPRHGIRLSRDGAVTEYVICFECNQAMTYRGTEAETVAISQSPKLAFNSVLNNEGVTIAP